MKEIEFLENEFRLAEEREQQLNAALEEMIELYKKAMAKDVDDLKEFLKDPSAYLVEQYWKTYCKDRPAHLNKAQVFTTDTGVDPNTLEAMKTRFYGAFEKLRDSKPAITKKGLKSNLKREDYCLYLDEAKKGEYEALETFLKAAGKLEEKYGAFGNFNLLRFANKLHMGKDSKIEINPYEFRAKSEFQRAI
ncbi:MAG: hypothetical protein ABGX00_13315 [Allomuricauda sp.]